MYIPDEEKWERILALWGHPRINPPLFYECDDDAPPIAKGNVACFSLEDHLIHVNREILEKTMGPDPDIVDAVVCHEPGHYALIPHSPEISLILSHVAYTVLGDWPLSHFVENIFDDLVLNTYIVEHSPEFGPKIIDALSCMEPSDRFGSVYLRSYELLWDLPENTIIHPVNQKHDQDAHQVARIVKDCPFRSSTWPDKVERLAKLLKPYLPEPLPTYLMGALHEPGDFGDVDKALERIASQLSLKDHQQVQAGTGKGNTLHASRSYYLGRAAAYRIALPDRPRFSGNLSPQSPQQWKPEDPIDELDATYSLSVGGALIPGVTTSRWDHQEQATRRAGMDHPDLCVILDSSGSMPNPLEEFSTPVLASFVASESALYAGCKVAVLNFSGEGQYTVTPYTHDRDQIHENLLTYHKGGTHFPTKEFEDLILRHPTSQHLLLITDGDITNKKRWMISMNKAIDHAGGGTLFLQGRSKINSLEKMGYRIHPMSTTQDLVDLTTKAAEEIYGR